MNRGWAMVLIAAFFEVLWVICLKQAANAWFWVLTIALFIVSFYFLVSASKHLPVGTVYAVFVGLGTAGAVLSEILFFQEPVHLLKLFFILVLLTGVIGLKLVTNEKESEEEKVVEKEKGVVEL